MALENYRTASRERMWQYDDMWHNTAAVIDTFADKIMKHVVSSYKKKKDNLSELLKLWFSLFKNIDTDMIRRL